MSSWQSFFNQLTKTTKQGTHEVSDIICQCEKGKLAVIDRKKFKASNNCSMSLFCSMIQIDKHRAKNFNNKISIISHKAEITDNSPYEIASSLDHLLEEKREV